MNLHIYYLILILLILSFLLLWLALGLESHDTYREQYVCLSLGETILHTIVYKKCPISLGGKCICSMLVQFEVKEFDLILGMDRLAKYHVHIDCKAHKIPLRSSKGER